MKMKKMMMTAACAAVSAMLLCACGSADAGTDNNGGSATNETVNSGSSNTTNEGTVADKNETAAPEGFGYTLKGTFVVPDMKMEGLKDSLGEPTSFFESDSCAFQGKDRVYTYGSVVISTYEVDGVEQVYTIELKDDTVETDEGVCIGSSKEDVKAAYGTPTTESDTTMNFNKGKTSLAFIFDGDSVSYITFSAVTE